MLMFLPVYARTELPSADGAKALLEPPVIKHEGIVPWWRFRSKKESLGVEQWCPPDVEYGEMNSRFHCHQENYMFSPEVSLHFGYRYIPDQTYTTKQKYNIKNSEYTVCSLLSSCCNTIYAGLGEAAVPIFARR